MKIKFIESPPGRPHKVGDVVDFNGPIPEGYARKYINRGWAVEAEPESRAPVRQPAAERPAGGKVQGGYQAAGGGDKPPLPTTGSGVKPT